MDISINGKKIDFLLEQEKNIGEVLGSIESECEKSGLTVNGIRVDGVDVPADGLDALFLRETADVSRIELTTISGKDVIQLLRDLSVRFRDCVPFLKDIPVLLQTGKDLQVLETIHRFSTDLESLYRLLPLLSITGTGPKAEGLSELESCPSELAPILGDLLGALEAKDTVLVGDLSEYELAPRIEKLSAALAAVQ